MKRDQTAPTQDSVKNLFTLKTLQIVLLWKAGLRQLVPELGRSLGPIVTIQGIRNERQNNSAVFHNRQSTGCWKIKVCEYGSLRECKRSRTRTSSRLQFCNLILHHQKRDCYFGGMILFFWWSNVPFGRICELSQRLYLRLHPMQLLSNHRSRRLSHAGQWFRQTKG